MLIPVVFPGQLLPFRNEDMMVRQLLFELPVPGKYCPIIVGTVAHFL